MPGQPSGDLRGLPTPFPPEVGAPVPTAVAPAAETRAAAPPTVAPPTPAPTPAPAATPAPSPAVVRIQPEAVTAAVDAEFVVNVTVDGATDVSHAPFYLLYDPAVVEVVDVADGGFLGSDGRPTQFVRNPAGGGRLIVGLSRLGRGPGVGGSGVLVTVRMKALAAGMTELRFAESSLRDADSRPLAATFVPGRVTVR
jgi:general secretion pathway protein D